jgi:hypothetical protein
VLGVVPFLGGVLGVVFGIIGLRHCRRNGDRGRGLAIAGIVIGALALVFWVAVIAIGLATSTSNSGSGLGAVLY